MKARRILVLIVFILSGECYLLLDEAFAINHDRCSKRFPFMYKGVYGPGAMLAGFFSTTTHPIDSSTYSSQVTSSWGECSLVGAHDQRNQFLYANSDNVMVDSARGRGEYVDALAQLSGCQGEKTRESFGAAMQKNFEQVYFDGKNEAKPEKVGARIDKVILSHPELKRSCKIAG